MALNGSWGTGKTTFVRMWQKYLENAGYKTAYINAWEMDFATNPLVPTRRWRTFKEFAHRYSSAW